ncbi:hypothetical protein AB3Y40_10110 [Yoonia sp. R2331]|uniref:hypothetical protein n=1 Tax=Yoonia sp. R2331 TaxID=3237238 RepID=UPI0034E47D4B
MTYFQRYGETVGLIGCAGFVTAWGIEQNLWFAAMAGIGALVSGVLLARLFGEAGALGWLLAGFAAAFATVLGAALVGAAMIGPERAGFAVAAVAELLWEQPLAGARWLALMGAAHAVALGPCNLQNKSSLVKQ